jgi:hypothetical protein
MLEPGCARPPDARPARPPVPARVTHPRHRAARPPRLVLPVPRHPARRSGQARATWCRATSARCPCCCRPGPATPSSCWPRRSAPGPPRLLLARHQRRLRGAVHRARCRSSSRPTRRCRAPSGATSSTSARSRGLGRGRPPAGRGAAAAPNETRRAHRRPSSPSASPTAPPSRPASARSPTRAGRAAGPPRPRRPHRAALRRVIDLVLEGVVTGVRKSAAGQVVTTFALGTRALYDFLHENPRSSCSRSTGSTTRASSAPTRLRVDQRHHRGRLPGPVRVGDDRPAATGPAAAARPTSPGAPCTPRAARASSCCPPRPGTAPSRASSAQLTPGSVVTTLKNTVDKVVTEHGVAELRGRSIRERADALIAVAHPRSGTSSDVIVVAERDGGRGLHRSGKHEAGVLADLVQIVDQLGVTRVEASPHPRQVRPLRERVDRDHAVGARWPGSTGPVRPT